LEFQFVGSIVAPEPVQVSKPGFKILNWPILTKKCIDKKAVKMIFILEFWFILVQK
jgi:plastocyanin domain-containing protein